MTIDDENAVVSAKTTTFTAAAATPCMQKNFLSYAPATGAGLDVAASLIENRGQ
jgi:hypothetical protein